jgi:type II secretory pathway component GspD/PulD (secretin)
VANGATNAVFSVGDREPIIRTEIQRGTIDSPGDIITAELDTDVNTEYISDGYLATGIDLRVIPVVKTDNLIEAEIIPSLRRKTDDKFVAGNSWPIISVKEIRTRFTLRSGQTVAIGGLTDTSNLKDTTQIPFLGSIPLIGKYLFSHTEDVKKQVETIIFVTLSLAQPETLYDNVGIPLNADLVHRRMIKDRVTFQEREDRLQQLQEAADAAQMERERETRARMLRRRE